MKKSFSWKSEIYEISRINYLSN